MKIIAACLLSCALPARALADAGIESASASFDGTGAAAKSLLDAHRMARASAAGDPHNEGLDAPVSFPDAIPIETAASISDFQALYVTGAKTAKIYGPRDDGYRLLSMKICSMRDSGNIINMIGVTDITPGGAPSLTRFFSMNNAKTTYFRMTEGGREYSFELSWNGTILLKRINNKQGEPGQLATSLRELNTARNIQIMQGSQVTIDGLLFYVIGQGGAKGSFLFFQKDAIDRDPDANAHPDLMGNVAQVLSDGSTVPITGWPRLGSLRNGDEFHLEFGNDMVWHAMPGPGNVGD